jgi:transcriptional regulator with XRE-family HTH domain
VTAEHLGDRLARLRRERAMTQEELAENAAISVDVVRKLEQRRKHSTRLETLHKLARGLHVDSATLLGEPDSPSAADPSFTPLAAEEAVSTVTKQTLPIPGVLGRRTLIDSVAGAAIVARIPDTRHVDPALVPYFQQQLEGHYRADMMLGPHALTPTVTAQCDLIGQLVDNADRPIRHRMAKVGTSFATFAAWLYLDAGDAATALSWHDVAQEFAHRSHDPEAVACALVDRAMAYTDWGWGPQW